MPTLYVVATPIGNLEDITLRALRTLREARLIASEDTRQTKRLLTTYDIKTRLTSYHEHNKLTKLDHILSRLKQEDVALVCDGGMPGISDPGYELIVAASRRGVPVVAIPGPSVITTALAVSGMPLGKFVYVGFLPRKTGERRRFLKSVIREDGTIVILETPHRLRAALQDILLVLGDRELAVCRELTKVHEEVFRGSVSEAIVHFAAPRGEFTLVIEGRKGKDKLQITEEVKSHIRSLRVAGSTAREAIAEVAGETGLSKRELYNAWLESVNVN